MEAVHAAPVGVALDHDRAHVVVEHFDGHAAEGQHRVLVASDQRLDTLIVTELDVGRAAPSERRDEHLELVAPTPDRRPVRLHLMAGRGLEAYDRFWRYCRHQPAHELLQPSLAALVAAGEQNEVLRDLLKDAVHICDEATAAGRPPAASSAFANVYRSVVFQSVSLRSHLQQQWRRLLTVTHLPLPYRSEVSPSVGWPFEPVLYGSASVGSVGAPPNPEQITVDAGPASSSAAFDPSAHETTRARLCGASPHSIATRR